MATNKKTHEKKIKRIEKSIINDRKIAEAIKKGGKLEIRIKEDCIEFWRKEKGKEKELVSSLEKISDNRRCLRGYSDIVLDLIGKYWDSNPDYKVSLTVKNPNRKASLTLKYI